MPLPPPPPPERNPVSFSPGMVTEFWFASHPHTEIGVHQHRQFQAYFGNCVKKWCMKASQSFVSHLVWILLHTYYVQAIPCVVTVLKICSFSGLRSSLLHLDREIHAGTNLCRWYACFSPTSEGSTIPSQLRHWSNGRWVYWTISGQGQFILQVNLELYKHFKRTLWHMHL